MSYTSTSPSTLQELRMKNKHDFGATTAVLLKRVSLRGVRMSKRGGGFRKTHAENKREHSHGLAGNVRYRSRLDNALYSSQKVRWVAC